MIEDLFDLPGCITNHLGQGQVYLVRPEGAAADASALVVCALHGSGREAVSYRDVPFYAFQRDCALAAGYSFVAMSNGPDGWGLDHGLQNLLHLHAYLTREYETDPVWVLWATSAGGVLMHRIVHERPDLVRGVVATFPVYDLIDVFHHCSSSGKAWGATTEEALREAVTGRNPPEFVADLSAREYLILHGREDATLDPEAHTLRFEREVAEYGGHVRVVMTPGGHSTENAAVCNGPMVDEYLRRWRG